MSPRLLLDRLVEFLQGGRAYTGLRGVGQEWERLAERHLKSAGYEILERNFVTRSGEIDFIAKESGTLCFVEVKGRSGTAFGHPADAVTREKQRRIFRSAEAYLMRRRLGDVACRFDVVTILGTDASPKISILRDAFQGPPPARSRP
jgi:putative endonuclease